MRPPRPGTTLSIPAAILLAIAIHFDWHLARHHGRLSAAWPLHWTVALPVFAVAAWYIARRWPDRPIRVTVGTLLLAALIGQVLEPLAEYVLFGWPLSEGFGPERLGAFASFFLAGVAATALTLAVVGRARRRDRRRVT